MTYKKKVKTVKFQNGEIKIENDTPIFKTQEDKKEAYKKANSELFDIFVKLNMVVAN